MITFLVLQLVLPVVLLAWLALGPARSWLGLALQLLATVSLFAALHLAGLWLMPPWWAIWLYWLLLAAALPLALRNRPRRLLPTGIRAWAAAALCALLAAYAGWTAARAWAGRQVPAGRLVELRFPLRQGSYLVVNGGTNTSVSAHAHTLARATPGQRFYYGQSHAVDLVALNRLGLASSGFEPGAPERYSIFGHAVFAPCAGIVVQAAEDKPDMRVPLMDSRNMVGNHVLLRCRGADILLAHFRKGSLGVRPGQRVAEGQLIAAAGNSGNSSAPHLHIHAQEPGPPAAPFSGKPLPMSFGGRYLVRGDRVESRR